MNGQFVLALVIFGLSIFVIALFFIVKSEINSLREEIKATKFANNIRIRELKSGIEKIAQRASDIEAGLKTKADKNTINSEFEKKINETRERILNIVNSKLKDVIQRIDEKIKEATQPTNPIQPPSPSVETPSAPIVPTLPQKTSQRINEFATRSAGGNVTVLIGGAGTGKTTIIKEICESNKRAIVAAPTGLAAIEAGGTTIHSLFHLPPTRIPLGASLSPLWEEKCLVLREAQLIIIDEISMVAADILDAVDLRLREVCERDVPFGGKKILLVGDPFQLPPVVDSQDLWRFDPQDPRHTWESAYFFDSMVFRNGLNVDYVELTEIHRQKDVEFIKMLNDARHVRNLDKVCAYFNQQHRKDERTLPQNTVYIFGKNKDADGKNERELRKLLSKTNQRLYESVAHIAGNGFSPSDDKKLPAPYKLCLCVGAPVMFLINDPGGAFANGSIGKVKKICKKENAIHVEIDGRNIVVHKTSWDKKEYVWDEKAGEYRKEVVSTFEQFPLRLAWAMTIHKSQGQTIPCLYASIGRTWEHGQAYTALSRTQKLENLFLKHQLTPTRFKANARLDDWYLKNFDKPTQTPPSPPSKTQARIRGWQEDGLPSRQARLLEESKEQTTALL